MRDGAGVCASMGMIRNPYARLNVGGNHEVD